jgi:hypothetical protein
VERIDFQEKYRQRPAFSLHTFFLAAEKESVIRGKEQTFFQKQRVFIIGVVLKYSPENFNCPMRKSSADSA